MRQPIKGREFEVFQDTKRDDGTGSADVKLWQFIAETTPVADLPFSDRDRDEHGFKDGLSRFTDAGADRIKYQTCYFFLEHSDGPGGHDFLPAIRFHFQRVFSGKGGRINDKDMREDPFGRSTPEAEVESQGLAQYPYETRAVPPKVSRIVPATAIEVVHLREGTMRGNYYQVLRRVTLDTGNPRIRWWYQDRGLFYAAYRTVRPVASLIISGMHPAYSFRLPEVPTEF